MKKSFIKKLLTTCFAIFLASCSIKYVKHDIDHLPEPVEIKDINVALVLGGGGSRGVAHLGVIDVFEEFGIPIDLIVGTSAGSVIGALYADSKDSKKVRKILSENKVDDVLSFSYLRSVYGFFDITAAYSGEKLEQFMAKNLVNDHFSKLKIPLVVTATDLNTEKSLAIAGGKVSPAVRASSMAPPFFTPTNIYGKLLVDGGVVEPVPVITAMQYKPKVVIAVDISVPGDDFKVDSMVDVTLKSMYISYYIMSRMQSSLADVTIHPNLTGFDMFNEGFDVEIFNRGREEALNKLPKIMDLLKEKGISTKPRLNFFTLTN